MALEPGAKLGPYEVLAPLGAGGMDEVYRAKDARLDRTVAIKVLPFHVAGDPAARQRFEREARAVSSLNHPHICTLHDIGSQDGLDYLVMEHIEGETLARRLRKGALPLDRSLQLAVEIADALDKAHRQGVVHRDLKPSNVMLTKSGAKLLDFGLAKLQRSTSGALASSQLPTEAEPLTAEGTVLGTFQYMSPEQLEGKEADARTDIFAFGAVLYETLTGRRAFQGKSQASLIAAILEHDPPALTELQPMTPPLLDRVVRRCLEKDPDERWQSASDLAIDLRWIAEGVSPTAEGRQSASLLGRRPVLSMAVVAVLAAAVGALVGRGWLGDARVVPDPGLTRVTVELPPGRHLSGGFEWEEVDFGRQRPSRRSLALSPDGRQLVYVASDGAIPRLYRRPMDQVGAMPMPGTEGASIPFFAPDGEAVAFFVGDELKRISIESGEVRAVTTSGPAFEARRGASWTADDTILLASADGVYAVPANGGSLSRLTTGDSGPRGVAFPELLPGGRAVLHNVLLETTPSEWNIVVESLDTGERHVVVEGGSDPRYVSSGHVLFVRTGTLMAVPFDVTRLEVTGPAIVVVEDVMHAERGVFEPLNTGAGQFSVSRAGALAYLPGGVYPLSPTALVWVDRTGTSEPLPLPPGDYWSPRFSPDGTRLVYLEGPTGDRQVWVYDIELQTPIRLTTAGHHAVAVWSPDGTRLALAVVRDGRAQLFTMAADGSGEPERLGESDGLPSSWSPDGVLALLRGPDIWTVSMDGDGASKAFLQTPFSEAWPAFSPDGRWLAYASNETGRNEVYVRPFPGGEPAQRVSTAGGAAPVWSPDGRQLFFRSSGEYPLGGITVVDVTTDTAFTRGQPRTLIDSQEFDGSTPVRGYDLAPDGRRFVMRTGWSQLEPQPVTEIHLVLNWLGVLTARVPMS